MTLLDANVLLDAYDQQAKHHAKMRKWLETLLSGRDTVGIPWVTAWAFVRIVTNPRLNEHSLNSEEAMSIIEELAAHPEVVMVNPGKRHSVILAEQMRVAKIQGPETTDAVIAALAIENGAKLASTDAGFRRFPELRWADPLA